MQEPYNALVKFVKAYNVLEEEESDNHTHMKVDCLLCLSLVYFILDDDKNTKQTLEKVKALNICEKEVKALE